MKQFVAQKKKEENDNITKKTESKIRMAKNLLSEKNRGMIKWKIFFVFSKNPRSEALFESEELIHLFINFNVCSYFDYIRRLFNRIC